MEATMFLDEKRFGEPQYLPRQNSNDCEEFLYTLFLFVVFVFFKTIGITADLTKQVEVSDFCWVVSNTALIAAVFTAIRMYLYRKVK